MKVFDEKQQEVINFNSGCALVLGAPGCGKTDILSHRVLRAHQVCRIDYRDMLCLTFTNRASREMKERIRTTIGDITGDLFVGNLHRFCIRFIYDNNLVPIDVCIVDDVEQEEIISELSTPMPVAAWQIRQVTRVAAYNYMKDNDFPAEIRCNADLTDFMQNRLADKYIEYKRDNRIIDFDDILLITYKALMEEGYREKYMHSSYKWIQVDEVQDLNPLQLAIIDKLIAPDYDSVVYLGDERQAIYSFMGSKCESLSDLRQKAGENQFVLSHNYRSPMYLLDMLNNYAIYKLKVDASLLPETDNKEHLDDALMLVGCANEDQERDVISTLGRNIHYTNPEESIAILVRTNKDADSISSNLERHKISHMKFSNKDVFKTVDFKTLHSHFSVVANDTKLVDWARILYQTKAFETLALSKKYIREMRSAGLTPLDLMLYENSSYFMDFCSSYADREVVVFDTETTGLDIFNDDIIQIAALKMKNGQVVPGSEIDIVIKMDEGKTIPPTLRGGLLNPMVEEYARRSIGHQELHQFFMDAHQAFKFFAEYVGDAELLGHNVNYDVHILENNIRRRAPEARFRMPKYWDTLKMARLLDPNIRKHTLESLLEHYGLDGVNSHNALDDIRATKSLVDSFYVRMSDMFGAQVSLLSRPELKKAQRRLIRNYLPVYQHTYSKLYSNVVSVVNTLDCELEYVYRYMTDLNIIKEIKMFPYIRQLFGEVMLNQEEDIYFNHQLVNHLYEMRTFNEGDFFQNGIMSEKVFIMTIHKAKGLEFDNVLLYDISDGRMPWSGSRNMDEDARVLYVAMSRAKKRLYITYSRKVSSFLGNHPQVMEHFEEMLREKKDLLLKLEDSFVKYNKA